MPTVKDIYDYIDSIAPFETQEDWDNSGLLLGDPSKKVQKAVLSLDATKQAVEFAESIAADILITHHPVIFKGLKQISPGDAVYELIKNDIAVISCHTPYDKAEGGINDALASLLGLENTRRLENGYLVAGELKDAMSIDDFAEFVKDKLDSKGLRYTDTEKVIKKVCVGGGSCSEFMWDAASCSDCFVTGDIKYHEMLDFSQAGNACISAGHFETESQPFLTLCEKLKNRFKDAEFIKAPVKNIVMDL